jgi:hypothetical protein
VIKATVSIAHFEQYAEILMQVYEPKIRRCVTSEATDSVGASALANVCNANSISA